MDTLVSNFNYIESIKSEIKEGDYLVIMRILQDYYLRITGEIPTDHTNKLCITEGCEEERFEDNLCDRCYYGWATSESESSSEEEDYI